MDAAYKNAMARRDQLAAEINQIQQRLDELRREIGRVDSFLRDWAEFAGAPAATVVDSPDTRATSSDETKPRAKNPPKEAVVEVAREILRSRGEPMGRSALYNALLKRGVVLEGADPEMVLSTMLWRMKDEIVRIPKHGYWLADVSHESSGYVAPQDAKVEHKYLIEQIEKANHEYNRDYPTFSDADYDNMRRRIRYLEEIYPDIV